MQRGLERWIKLFGLVLSSSTNIPGIQLGNNLVSPGRFKSHQPLFLANLFSVNGQRSAKYFLYTYFASNCSKGISCKIDGLNIYLITGPWLFCISVQVWYKNCWQLQWFPGLWEHDQFSPLYWDIPVLCKFNNIVVTIWWVHNKKYTCTGILKLFLGHRLGIVSQWLVKFDNWAL